MFSSQDNMLPYALRPSMMDRRRKPGVEVAPNCPRCDSSNTKFCYYNNYSLRQPRYFCKGCRRYWTKGGSLRNVPYGGGCRKNRRGKSLRISSSLPAGIRDPPQARRTPLGSLRPDLALDDMVGNSCQFHGSNSMSSLDVSSSDGSNIDLAVLYAKFLNQCPVLDPVIAMPQLPVEMDQPFGFIAAASDLSYQMPIQLSDQHSVGDQCPLEPIPGAMLDTVSHSSVGELDFSFEPCGFESLASPVEGVSGDNLLSSCLIVPSLAWQEPKYEGFGSVDDNDMVDHQNPPINGWTTLDQSSYIALPSNMYRS